MIPDTETTASLVQLGDLLIRLLNAGGMPIVLLLVAVKYGGFPVRIVSPVDIDVDDEKTPPRWYHRAVKPNGENHAERRA